jgi:hypothetical protein
VNKLAKVAARFPQTAYAGLQKPLQQEWQFLQCVTNGLDLEFLAITTALHYDFLLAGSQQLSEATGLPFHS